MTFLPHDEGNISLEASEVELLVPQKRPAQSPRRRQNDASLTFALYIRSMSGSSELIVHPDDEYSQTTVFKFTTARTRHEEATVPARAL